MNAFASAAPRAFERLSDKAGALPGDVRLFDRNPGPGWVAEDAIVPYSARRAGLLPAASVGGFAFTGAPFANERLLGMTRVGSRLYVWQEERIAYTDDGGDTWTTITTNANRSLGFYGGAVLYKGLIVIAGYTNAQAAAFVDTSANGGGAWDRRLTIGNATNHFLESDGNVLYAGGQGGVHNSQDGLSWSLVSGATFLSCVVAGDYVYFGTTGGIFRKPKGLGGSLEQVYSSQSNVWALAAGADGTLYAGASSSLLRSLTGNPGSWGQVTNIPPPDFGDYITSIADVDGLILVGWRSTILSASKDLQNWSTVTSLTGGSNNGANGLARIVYLNNRLFLGGAGFKRGGVTSQRGFRLEKPTAKRSWKAYTRL